MTAQAYRLSGAVNPRGEGPAVCVPAFSSTTDNYTYIQYISIDDTVLLFELSDWGEWELVKGSPPPREVTVGSPAIYWVTWSDDLQNSIIGDIGLVRAGVIDNRWVIDATPNPFERLDFAQLSGQYEWFSEEARNCESSFNDSERDYWLRETLFLSRVRFAIDSVLLSQSVPLPTRRRVSSHVRVAETTKVVSCIDDLCKKYVSNHTGEAVAIAISQFLERDVAYRYAAAQIFGTEPTRPARYDPAKWYKQLTRSDAQRKRTGNQRGGITLVKAGFPVDTQTYFREDLFGHVDWVPGKTRTNKDIETASIRMATSILGIHLGVLSFSVSYARNRHARQNNYTSILHLGPLSAIFSSQNMTDKWLCVERLDDGSFSLTITNNKPS